MCPGHPNSWPSRASPSGDPRVLGALSNPPLTLDFLLPPLPLTTSVLASTPAYPAPTPAPLASFSEFLAPARDPAAPCCSPAALVSSVPPLSGQGNAVPTKWQAPKGRDLYGGQNCK